MDTQPDQQRLLWDHHVCGYETVFEPLTCACAAAAIDRLQVLANEQVIDVAAGCGGAALMLAQRGARVLAVDAAWRMAERARDRLAAVRTAILGEAQAHGPRGAVAVMDGVALAIEDAGFDVALSVFGIVLFPDAVAGVREMVRVLRPGARAALATWIEPENYELMSELMGAIREVVPDFPPPPAPHAQLRYREEVAFRALLEQGGLRRIAIDRIAAALEVPSARWLAMRITFAPGMAALFSALGPRRDDVLTALVSRLETIRGTGSFALGAVAWIGVGSRL